MGFTDKIYSRLPVWAQNFSVSAYGYYWKWLRFGPGYAECMKDYKSRDHFISSDWASWQQKRLSEILKYAVDHVPFYQRSWTDVQKKMAYEGKLTSLPLLEKKSVRMRPRDFLRTDFRPAKELSFYTSGSTGTPIQSIWAVSELRSSMALREVRSANLAGVSFQMPRATFSGRLVEPDPNSKGPFYRWNQAERQVYFSAFHLKADTAISYVKAIEKHKIQWGTGYAYSFYLLAKYILDKKIKLKGLKAVITTSEKLEPYMRPIMEEAYQCPVYEEYSAVENVLFASECEKGSLHASPDVGVVEILNKEGQACLPGEPGEVVATGLMRSYQIFVRYRLGDIAAWSDKVCACGRQMPVLREVTGRVEDAVTGPDGRQLVRFHGIFVGLPKIIEGQVIQEGHGKFCLKVVVSEGFGDMEKNIIRKRFEERLGKIELKIETVKDIPRTSSGKFKAVVNLIKKSDAK